MCDIKDTLCCFLLMFLSFIPFQLTAQTKIPDELKNVIDSTFYYDRIKSAEIGKHKSELKNIPENEPEKLFGSTQQLYEDYKVFKSDSAYYYGLQTKKYAEAMQSEAYMSKAYLNLADICISVGMYNEALSYLSNVKIEALKSEDEVLYYGIYGRCYSDMAEYSSLPNYSKYYLSKAKTFREKSLNLTEPGSFFNLFMLAYNEYMNGKYDLAVNHLNSILKFDLDLRSYALTHFVLGEIYRRKNQPGLAEHHYTIAVIADIKTSTKESLALIKLSELLFAKKDLEVASFLIEKANDDAKFYGAQQRKLQVGAILPLIEEEILSNIQKEKERLYWQYVGTIVFTGILIIFISIIVIQVKRLQKARRIIDKSHSKLKEINKELMAVNRQMKLRNEEIEKINAHLSESNTIKEEYLGFFFSEYENILEKFNELAEETQKDLSSENYTKALYRLSRYDLKKEKEKLLHNFDTAFISLFPNFIEEFNSLMKEGCITTLKEGQILNKELRIFALIRLGIKHNEKIAQILGYSVNSIYAYKTKIRNNSILKNEDFDQKLLDNTSIKP